jgi:2-dehydropantoate 2-reductase
MRYVIIGAGAIGGVLGARLAQHSTAHPPLLIARGEHGRRIAAVGIRLLSPDENAVIAVQSAGDPGDVRLLADDVLVLATKSQQAEDAIRQWVDRPVFSIEDGMPVGTAGERLPILLALNGVASERIALRYFERVFGVCVWLPAVHLTPGEVMIRIAPASGTFIFGRYGTAATEADAGLLETIRSDWTAATFDIHIVDDVMRWKYSKLLGNLGNALQALLGSDDSGYRELGARVRAEGESVLASAGIDWASAGEERAWRGGAFAVRPIPGFDGEVGGSSWQSMSRGSGSIESDYLNGEIAYLARSHGLTAPLNARIQGEARRAAAAGRAPGDVSIDDLDPQTPSIRAD